MDERQQPRRSAPPPPPPPPPPPIPFPNTDDYDNQNESNRGVNFDFAATTTNQRETFEALKHMGYAVDELSPWELVTKLLRDLATVQSSFLELNGKLDKAEQDKLVLILEIAKKAKESSEENSQGNQQQGEEIDSSTASKALSKMAMKNRSFEQELLQLRQALSNSQMECQRLASIANYAVNSKDLTKTELEIVQKTHTETQQAISNLALSLEEEKRKSTKLEEEIDNLQVEIVKLEGARNSALHRVERIDESARLLQKSKEQVEQELEKSREENRMASELLLEERRSRKQTKAQLDEITRQLAKANDEVLAQQQKYVNLEKVKLEVESQSSILKRQVAAQSEALSQRESELRTALSKNETLEQNLSDERKSHGLRLHELRAAAQDVSNMSRENRELTNAFEKLNREVRETKAALDESRSKTQRFAGMLDSAKLERSELLTVYQRVCDENSRLKNEVSALSKEKAEVMREEQAQSGSIVEMQNKLAELDLLCKKQRIDIDNYDRKVDGLSRELRASRAKCEALEDGKSLAERSSGNEQQRYLQAARQHEAINWELEQTRIEFANCASQLEKALDENTKLAEQLVTERLKVSEMESQVERARVSQARAMISSGQAFTSTAERMLKSPLPLMTTTGNNPPSSQARSSIGQSSASRQGGQQSGRKGSIDDSSSLSSMRDFDDRFEELERVMGGDDTLSEATSVIRQTREERSRGGGFQRPSPASRPTPLSAAMGQRDIV